MTEPAKRRATYQDVLDAPDDSTAELIAGELVLSPRPASGHSETTSGLGYALGPPFHWGRGGPGGWILLFEPELHLTGNVLVPDLAGWRRQRLPQVPRSTHIDVTSDWVCEVLSPSTSKRDRTTKFSVYAELRIGHYWIIDPTQRTLEVYQLEGRRWLLLGTFSDNAKVRAEPFDAIELELELLWPGPPESPVAP